MINQLKITYIYSIYKNFSVYVNTNTAQQLDQLEFYRIRQIF